MRTFHWSVLLMDARNAQIQRPDANRRSANYPPCIWGDFFLQYASISEGDFPNEKLEHERLKEDVRKMLAPNENGRQKLELIDLMQRLGISHHFEDEIEAITKLHKDEDGREDSLHAVALRFRLLRQLGHHVSCDVFKKFKDTEGKFKESLSNNIEGILSLYEAAYFRLHEEHILEEGLIFATSKLQSVLANLDDLFLGSRIKQALNLPIQKTIPRVGARKFISLYEGDKSHDAVLLQFAKLDFNILQRIHKKELSTLTKWWIGIDCEEKLSFARHRLVESYYLTCGTCFEPKYSFARTAMAKIICLTTILDDIYDLHATYDELVLFTDAFQRWDISALVELPPYMQHYYQTLLDVYSDVEEMLAKKGKSELLEYAVSSFKELARAYFQEAKWIESGYVPNYDEYMENGLVSFACDMSTINFLVCMAEFVAQDSVDWLSKKPLILTASDLLCRLVDDLATHESEKKRGETASAVECYMRQYGKPKEETFAELKRKVTNAWIDINEGCLDDSVTPMFVREKILNFFRIVADYYRDGVDDYTYSSTKLKPLIESMFVDPVPL